MTRDFHLTAAFVALALLLASTARGETDTQRVARQFRDYCLHESTDRGERLLDDVELPKAGVAEAMKWRKALKEDGSWGDINYPSAARSSWPAYDHLTRVLSLVVYARRSGTPPDDSAQCLAAAHRALGYWIAHDFQCPNWWYNDIGVPKILGNVGLLLDNDLKPAERDYITGVAMARSKVGSMTGQNRVWLAGNGVMRAALLGDESLLRTAAGVIREEIRVTTGEGIQPDWSFHQHGPQQQFGNYGMAFAVEMSRWATVLRGTASAFPEPKLAIIRNYLLGGQNWVAWRGMLDISACGRQLFPHSPRSKVGALRGVMKAMQIVDSSHANDYAAFVTRNVDDAPNDLVGNLAFWRSDYVVHRRPETFVSLKMSSDRVIGGETVNSEDLSGLHLADGATYFYRTGHEYEDIFPVWDWRNLPGVTSSQAETKLTWPKADLSKAPSFVGGVSDGTNGCAAMDFHRGELRAKKAWFFSGDVVVCVGAGINSPAKDDVLTTVDQCLLKGPVTIDQAEKQTTLSRASRQLNDADWIEHDGWRYVFPSRQAIVVSAESRTGNWSKVFQSPSTPKADVTKDVFSLGIDHGEPPRDGTYTYYVVPAKLAETQQVKILSNSAQVQSVQVGEHWSAAVFWTAGSAKLDGAEIQVDQPCLLMMDSNVGDRKVTLADPTHQLKTLQLKLDGKAQTVELPHGDDAGKSITVAIASAH